MVGPFRKPKVPRPRRQRRPLVLPQAPGQRNRRPRLNSLNANNSQRVLQSPLTSGGNSPENRRREQNARRNRQRRARNRRSGLLTQVENQSAPPRIGLFEMNTLLQRILQQGDDFVRQIMQCPFFSQFISDLRNRASSNPASVVRLSPSLRHILLIPSRIDALIQPEQSLLRESQVANDSVQVQNAQEGVPNANENSCYENLDKKIQGANELSLDNINKNGSDQNQDIQDASNQSRNTEINEGNECGNNLILHQDIRYTSTSNPNQETNQSRNTERQDTRVNDANENGNGQSLNQDIQNASSSNPDREVNADNENRSGQNLNRDIQYASSNPDQEVNAGNVNSINQIQYQEAQEANKNGNDANPENNDDKNYP